MRLPKCFADSGAFVGEGDPFTGPEREEMELLMYVRGRRISMVLFHCRGTR